MVLRLLLIAGVFLFSFRLVAQEGDTVKLKTDTLKSKTVKTDQKSEKIKPYKEIITDKAVTDDGVFKVHKVENKYYFEIPDRILKKEFLMVRRLTKASAGMRSGTTGYAGDLIGQNVIAFEKGPDNKIFIREISYVDYTQDSTSQMYHSVSRNNVQPILMSFDVKAFGLDQKSCVIEVTDLLNTDNELVSFDPRLKKKFRVGAYQKDKSFVNFVKAFPTNLEINTTKTFAKANEATSSISSKHVMAGNYTMEINSSFVLLPQNKMQPRYFDPRVGYFTVGYTDFDLNPQGVKNVFLIKRWRLEPKAKDLEKYKRGQLVEPEKPIVFYIDPATPKKWVPYLMAGVNDWQKAFEKAGFKNAIYAKIPNPKDEPDWSLEDARFSAIVYKPSEVPNASGPSIADPRTGEILESHINWYHNVMLLLRNWYFVQASPNDPKARTLQFDDKLMGELIRFVSSHEVGHTLGLRHNFGSSATVPVEKLRDRNWLEKHGHTPSIMDYARFNYVAQPQDNVGKKGIMPRIGDYDDWAIEWGYRRFYQYDSPEAEKPYMNQWVIDKLKNPRLWFGTESNPYDPRLQSEQVGDNAMIAGVYAIENLKRVVNNLPKWTATKDEGFDNLATMYDQVIGQFARYLGHVSKYIGGVMQTPKTQEQEGSVYEVVSEVEQKQALEFLKNHIFTTPHWLLNKEVFDKTGKSRVEVIENLQKNVLNRILSPVILHQLYQSETMSEKAYPLAEYLRDLNHIVFVERPDLYRRNLQRNYVRALVEVLDIKKAPAPSSRFVSGNAVRVSPNSDVMPMIRGILGDLKKQLKEKAKTESSTIRYHYEDLVFRIEQVLDPSI